MPEFIRRRPEAAVFVLALVLRLLAWSAAWVDASRLLVQPDSQEYVTIARNLAAGHGFSVDASAPYRPDIRRTPVYPLVLATLFRAFRNSLFAGGLAGVVLGSVTAVLTYRLTRELAGPAAALWAGLLLASDISSVVYDVVLLTEGLFTLLLVASALWLVRQPRSLANASIAAVLLGGAILCRPIALLLPIALAPLVLYPSSDRVRAASRYIIVNTICGVAVAAWVMRNVLVAGALTFSSIGAVNVYFHRAAAVEAGLEGRAVAAVQEQWQHDFEQGNAAGANAGLAGLARQGLALIGQHPLMYASAYARGLVRMAGPDDDVAGQLMTGRPQHAVPRWLFVVSVAQLAAVYLLALWGLVRAGRGRAWWPVVVALTYIGYFVATAGPEVYPRFRVPVMPFILVLSGMGVEAMIRAVRCETSAGAVD